MAVSYVTGLNPGVRAPATHADRGLLLTLLELVEKRAPRTSTAIALAAGVPEEFAGHIERMLERNREHGLVDRGSDGVWSVTPAGAAAVT
jgi:hypothetical protein